MGIVYEAFDPVIERQVAIKTLRTEVFEQSQLPELRQRFKREAQAAGRLAHPNIVTIFDYGEHGDTPYIVMELMTGQELRHALDRGARLPVAEAARIITQLLAALSHAHEHGLVHRDIKPANIFMLEDGSIKVVDFGIARVEASNLTETGALLGTPAYMSPEQILGLPVDARSDIFSAGIILYELLTGDKPFTGTATTIMQKVLRQEPLDVSTLNPTLSAAWDTVLKRAMAKKPEARFSSAREFAQTVKSVLETGAVHGLGRDARSEAAAVSESQIETLRPSPAVQASAKEVESAIKIATTLEGSAPRKRGVWAALAAGVVAIAIAGGVLRLYLERVDAERVAAEQRAIAEKAVAEQRAVAAKVAQDALERERRDADLKARRDLEEKLAAERAARAKDQVAEINLEPALTIKPGGGAAVARPQVTAPQSAPARPVASRTDPAAQSVSVTPAQENSTKKPNCDDPDGPAEAMRCMGEIFRGFQGATKGAQK